MNHSHGRTSLNKAPLATLLATCVLCGCNLQYSDLREHNLLSSRRSVESYVFEYRSTGAPEASSPLKYVNGEQKIETLAVAQIQRSGYTAWDTTGVQTHQFDKYFDIYFGRQFENDIFELHARKFLLNMAQNKRLVLVQVSEKRALEIDRKIPICSDVDEHHIVVGVSANLGVPYGTVHAFDRMQETKFYDLQLKSAPREANDHSPVHLISTSKLKPSGYSEDYTLVGAVPSSGRSKFGVTKYALIVPKEWDNGRIEALLFDANGERLRGIDSHGKLCGTLSVDSVSFDSYVATFLTIPDQAGANVWIRVPTLNVDNIARILIGYQPRKLVEITGIPMFPR